MKAGIAGWLAISALNMGLIFAVACYAQDNSYSTTTGPPVSSDTATSGRPGTTTTNTTTGIDASHSWQQTATDTFHKVAVATESEYDHLASEVKDISLEARITTVLHENKATRGADVQVMAANGIATLTGRVPSEQDARRVQDVVASVYGVRAVNSDLNYPHNKQAISPSDAASTAVSHAYSDTAPVENAPDR